MTILPGTYLLVVTIDGQVVHTTPLEAEVATSAALVMERLMSWAADDQGYRFAQCEPRYEDGHTYFQLDFVTSDNSAATALAAVFKASLQS